MAIPQLITGFGQLGTTIKNVGSFLQNSYFTALKEAAAAELENAKAVEAKQKQQKDAIEAEMAALKTQYEKIKNDRDEAQGEIFLIQLEVEKNQALVNTLSILDSTNQKTLEKAKAELEVAQSLVTEAQAQEALNKLRLNGLKQEYNAKEASGNLGNKERSKYRAAIAEGELLSKDDEAQTANAEAMVNEAKIKVQVAEEKQAASTAALTDAREKLTDSTNRLTAAEEKFASSKEKLQEIESKVTSTISGSLSVLSDFKNAQDTVAAASAKYAKVIGLAEKETLTLGNAVKGLPTAFAALADKIGLSVGGLGALIGVAAVAAVAIGGVV
jgi:chromosome segregation ATPase